MKTTMTHLVATVTGAAIGLISSLFVNNYTLIEKTYEVSMKACQILN